MGDFVGNFLMVLLLLTGLFLILIILLQRGRGGGLVGAFGGMGGQSAFGAKAGDVFTRVTIVVATVWILLCVVTVKYFSEESGTIDRNLGSQAPVSESTAVDSNAPIDPSDTSVPATTGEPAAGNTVETTNE